jgi:signal transduction histidine kinase
VRALSALSRERPTGLVRVPVSTLIENVATLARSQALGRDVTVDIPAPPPDLPEVEASIEEIETVLAKLVSNGLEATPPGGRVSLVARSCARDGQPGVEIAISDTGRGIPDAILPRIFDPFFEEGSSGVHAGLGLAVAQRMAHASGGHIAVESELGHGTTMRLWLAGTSPGGHA